MLEKFKKTVVTGCLLVLMTGLAACGRAKSVPLSEVAQTASGEEKKEKKKPEKETSEKQKSEKETSEEKTEEEKPEDEKTMISVYVCGCVRTPGVYELPLGSRICDAVQAAGGMTAEAHETCLNQALKVKDEEVVRVPTKEDGEDILVLEKGQNEMCDAMAEAGLEPTGIDINAASKETLMTLPGIGASKAEAIIAYRKEHNGFSSKEELMEVKGIGPGVYEKLEERITVK